MIDIVERQAQGPAAWLIEHNDYRLGHRWWRGSLEPDWGVECWTMNANEAIRFSRKRDAEQAIIAFKITGFAKATEHVWIDAASVPPRDVMRPRDSDNSSLRQYVQDCRIKACSAWSDVMTKGEIDESKCQLAKALEERLRAGIDELADLSSRDIADAAREKK
jgi:hypothetical protein